MNAAAGLVEVRVPDMGNFKDVAIIDVLVKPGESIERESPLVTLETEKATMDVPSTVEGVVEKVHIAKGGTVSAGDLIVTVRSERDGAGASSAPQPAKSAPSGGSGQSGESGQPAGPGQAANVRQPAAAGREPSDDATATDVGDEAGRETGRVTADKAPGGAASLAEPRRDARDASGPARGAASDQVAEAGSGQGSVRAAAARSDGGSAQPRALPQVNEPGFSRAHAGPSVRKFARELGVDLTRISGHGFKGRITHEDVKAFVKGVLTTGSAASSPAAGWPRVPAVDFSQFGPTETQPLSRIQRIAGPRLHASWVNIPHVTQFDEADITELEETRSRLQKQAQPQGIKLTPLAFIMRACVKALQKYPQFNASLDESGANVILKKYLHIGFAADTPNGLMVPVVRDVDHKDIYEIARQLAELAQKARAGKLPATEMQGGCFTISSLGGIGGTAFTPIINAPEVAILGVSRSVLRPIFREDAFVPRLMLPLSLSYDHRVIDGVLAARFTTYLARTLADARGLTEAVP